MSGLDQPILISNVCYHVGHERSTKVADERGFFKEEGLEHYEIERGGLLPAEWEHVALGRTMWERGIDIATAVDVRAPIIQRAHGEDTYIVGGWRTQTQAAGKLIAAKGITSPEQLRGARVATREMGNLSYHATVALLRPYGIDAQRELDWIIRGDTAYGNEANPGDVLRSGEVTLVMLDGEEADRLISEGYPLILDSKDYYKGLGHWPPGKVIVTTAQTIEQRGEELAAFLRANLHAYWFIQDPANHSYMYELETRMRQGTRNATERKVRMLRTEAPRAPRSGPDVAGHMVMDGLVPRPALARVIEDLVRSGDLERPIEIDEVMKDAPSIAAYENLLSRGIFKREAVEEWRAVMA